MLLHTNVAPLSSKPNVVTRGASLRRTSESESESESELRTMAVSVVTDVTEVEVSVVVVREPAPGFDAVERLKLSVESVETVVLVVVDGPRTLLEKPAVLDDLDDFDDSDRDSVARFFVRGLDCGGGRSVHV